MSKASAFAPGHISGFFQVCDEFEDLAQVGSRNCGPCISAGVLTEVEVNEGSSGIQVYINEEEAKYARTTQTAVNSALKARDRTAEVKVRHTVQAPIAAGYGMSGAGVVGAVMALSEAMGLRLSPTEVSEIAHKAEVTCKTGLGDVGPQMHGGLVISLEPGSSPYGEWIEIEVPSDLQVVCGTWGPLSTSKLLSDPKFRGLSKELGGKALDELMKNRSVKTFMKASQGFARNLGVLDDEFEKVLTELSDVTSIGASAVMLGRAIFTLARSSEVEEVKANFLNYFESESIMVTPLDFQGARVSD